MSPNIRTLASALITIAAAGCAGNTEPDRARDSPDRYGAAVVIAAADLSDRSTSLLRLLKMEVSNLQVDDSTSCPTIFLRGKKRFVGAASAQVYVNGTRSVNTCILSSLNSADLARVEVYSSGITGRPGYRSHPDGLILVFTKGFAIRP